MDDNKFVLDPVDDVAIANWGSNWCMPSLEQIVELYNTDNTITEVATMNGVYGRKIISKKNGNSIFLPAGGYHNGSSPMQCRVWRLLLVLFAQFG